MDPATGALAAKAATSLFAGAGALSQASSMREQEEVNASIAETRALQTETAARIGIEQELASIQAAFAANGARPGVGNLEVIKDIRKIRERETRIAVGNEKNRASDHRRQGRAYAAEGTSKALGYFSGAGPSLFALAGG